MQELQEQRLEARHLAWKHRDEGAPVGVAFRLQAVEQTGVQSFHQAAQRGGAGADGVVAVARQFERGAPNLRTLLAIEVIEEFGESRDQVGLGEQRIDRDPYAEPRLQFVEAAADRRGVRLAFGRRRQGKVAQRERDQQAVQRLARPGLLEQIEEGVPARAIDRGVRVLRGIAAGCVDQHGVLGEPPVAQACAADAGDGALPHLLLQREAQAGVQQRRRLAGAGRADDRVPGLFVQIVAATQRLLQQVERSAEPRAQCLRLFGLVRVVGDGNAAGQRRGTLQAAQIKQCVAAAPGQQQRGDECKTRRPILEPRQERREEPRQTGEQGSADEADGPARGEDVGRRRH